MGPAGLIGIVGVENDVPPVETVAASIGDDVAGLERVVGGPVCQSFTQTKTVNTSDGLGRLHPFDATGASRFRAAAPVAAIPLLPVQLPWPTSCGQQLLIVSPGPPIQVFGPVGPPSIVSAPAWP